MPIVVRYFLIQLSGWILLTVVLIALRMWFGLSLWIVWGALALVIAKDVILYPWMRDAYSTKPGRWVGVDRVVGQRGLVVEELAPRGRVVVGGERWAAVSAVSESGSPIPIRKGVSVVVLSVDGLILEVSEEKAGDSMRA